MIPQTWLYTAHAIFSRSAGVGMTAASAMVDVLENNINQILLPPLLCVVQVFRGEVYCIWQRGYMEIDESRFTYNTNLYLA